MLKSSHICYLEPNYLSNQTRKHSWCKLTNNFCESQYGYISSLFQWQVHQESWFRVASALEHSHVSSGNSIKIRMQSLFLAWPVKTFIGRTANLSVCHRIYYRIYNCHDLNCHTMKNCKQILHRVITLILHSRCTRNQIVWLWTCTRWWKRETLNIAVLVNFCPQNKQSWVVFQRSCNTENHLSFCLLTTVPTVV